MTCRTIRRVAIVLTLGAAACLEPEVNSRPLALGVWGGPSMMLDVRSDGAMVEYDCAHGTVDEQIVIDNAGRFAAAGGHVTERGGPAIEGEMLPVRPALFEGLVEGSTLAVTVTLTDSMTVVGTFQLRRNQPPALVKCL